MYYQKKKFINRLYTPKPMRNLYTPKSMLQKKISKQTLHTQTKEVH